MDMGDNGHPGRTSLAILDLFRLGLTGPWFTPLPGEPGTTGNLFTAFSNPFLTMTDRDLLAESPLNGEQEDSCYKNHGWALTPWALAIAVGIAWGGVALLQSPWPGLKMSTFSGQMEIAPLVMAGGDPYLRALMRTISASEANTAKPYHVIYGGHHVGDLSEHPNRCVKIFLGPNRGNCSTASGRYQFLNTTWAEKAGKYHPQPQKFLLWQNYSFEPEYQDRVLYRWLADSQAWGMDISEKLQMGAIDEVLKHLSPTWTSLGYGIEDNLMTKHLPKLYHQLLAEELALKNHHSGASEAQSPSFPVH